MKFNLITLLIVLGAITIYACTPEKHLETDITQDDSNTNDNDDNDEGEKTKISYMDIYDPIADKGQYFFPEMQRKPKKYWSCGQVIGVNTRNSIDQTDIIRGLQYHLLCQSIAGLTNLAVEEGRSDIAVWLHDHSNKESYKVCKEALDQMGITEQGRQTGIELISKDYGNADNINIQLKDIFEGYVLTDIVKNPESAMVAAVASHVFNSIIVDIRDKEFLKV